jgi:hypothetical protein
MTYCTIPGGLATLAHASPGQRLEVRYLLPCARDVGDILEEGDRILCRDIGDTGVTVTTGAWGDVHIPWECARGVQVERLGEGEPAPEGDSRRDRWPVGAT